MAAEGGERQRRARSGARLAGFAEALEMTGQEFRLFQSLIYQEAGIHLAEHKRSLLVRRLRARVRELGLETFLDYYRLVTRSDQSGEMVVMLDLVSTNETRFFREPRQLDVLERDILPAWRRAAAQNERPKQLRAWCAACSSGEEPYTLAMLFARQLPSPWRTELLATDLSTRMLERAREATWPIRQVTDIPESYLKEYMLRGTGSRVGTMKAKSILRAMVRFERLNLHRDPMPKGPFDLILCRNVLIYFDEASKRRVIDRLLGVLSPDGYLLVGHAESISGLDARLRLVAPTIYARADEDGQPSEAQSATRARWRAAVTANAELAGGTERKT